MQPLVTAGAGFLLAVLWFDLMFDVQVLPYREQEMPAPVVASISTYYRRVTTEAGRMSRLVVFFMLVTVLGIVGQIVSAFVGGGVLTVICALVKDLLSPRSVS